MGLGRWELEECAINLRAVDETPAQRAFCAHLVRMGGGIKALQDLRDGDTSDAAAVDALLRSLLPGGAEASAALDALRAAVDQANAVLERAKAG